MCPSIYSYDCGRYNPSLEKENGRTMRNHNMISKGGSSPEITLQVIAKI